MRRSLVVDTSAAVAVILGEPGSEELAAYLEDALGRRRTRPTWHRSSGLSRSQSDRGLPAVARARSSYRYTVVGGSVVQQDGELTGARRGRVLRP